MSTTAIESRPEVKWRVLHQGDVSPFKLVVSLLIRELYIGQSSSANDIRKHGTTSTGEDRSVPAPTLLLLYKLITANEMTYPELKELIQNPVHKVRPEVLKKFNRILSNLEPGNTYFLYELIYSIISIESSQTIILKKKIGKNSPYGKFLRSVYMNIRRMSYPQVQFLYCQLSQYLNNKRKKASASFDDSSHVLALKTTPETSHHQKESKASTSKALKEAQDGSNMRRFRGLEIFQRLNDRLNDERKKEIRDRTGIGLDIFSQYIFEYRRASGNLSEVDEQTYAKCLADKKVRTVKALEASKSLRELWKPTSRSSSNVGTSKADECEDTMQISTGNGKRRSVNRRHLTPIRSSTRSPRKSRAVAGILSALKKPQEFLIVDEFDDEYLINPAETHSIPTPSKSPAKGRKGSFPRVSGSSGEFIRTSTPILKKPDKIVNAPAVGKSIGLGPGEKCKWDAVQGWSRRQIEKTVRQLADQLHKTGASLPSPKEISEFIEAAFRNPSAQVIVPQLYFLEYLNCLRLKDIKLCLDALRTSFDIRIKPNSSELNKGTPYAAYNFALFYNTLGYKEDAMACLEEAFRAGHAAGDATCLHHCHNLWSSFHNKPYKDAIVTVTQEVDNNMAYLHSLNVISNAFESHYQGAAPEEALYALWHYNAECDLEEMEGLLLTSLCSFFTIFGWHEMIAFPNQMILYSKFKWPTRAYCYAVCALSQCLLFHGDLELPEIIMNYGKDVFKCDVSVAGELFSLQHAIFKAFKSYLGYKPLENELISTIAAFDVVEATYWIAYNKVIQCDWESANSLLNRLNSYLNKCDAVYHNNDMKIRYVAILSQIYGCKEHEFEIIPNLCLLLQAELECLSNCPAGALNHLTEALEWAYAISSDIYVTLTLSYIASVQCEMGLLTTGSSTMRADMRAGIRCSSPWLKARLNVVNVKLSMRLQGEISKINYVPLMEKLNVAEELYEKWDNTYRLKEILHLKIELVERCAETTKSSDVLRKKLNETETVLPWSPETCLM